MGNTVLSPFGLDLALLCLGWTFHPQHQAETGERQQLRQWDISVGLRKTTARVETPELCHHDALLLISAEGRWGKED